MNKFFIILTVVYFSGICDAGYGHSSHKSSKYGHSKKLQYALAESNMQKPSGYDQTESNMQQPSGYGQTESNMQKPSGYGQTESNMQKPSGYGQTESNMQQPNMEQDQSDTDM